MSGDENQEELKQFEAELASLVPRRDRVDPGWGSVLAAKAAQSVAAAHGSPAARVPCEGPSGHVFVCVYCGRNADRTARAGRWGWPAALAAMTSVAAALLVMLVAGRGPRATTVGPATMDTNTFAAHSYPAASQPWRGSNRRILTSADRGSLDDFFARSNSLASNNGASTAPIEAGERHLTSSEFMQRLLRHPDVADAPLDPSIF